MSESGIIIDPNAPLKPDKAGAAVDPARAERVRKLIEKIAPQLAGYEVDEALAALLSMAESGIKSSSNPAMPVLMAGYLRNLADHLEQTMRERIALAAAPANRRPL